MVLFFSGIYYIYVYGAPVSKHRAEAEYTNFLQKNSISKITLSVCLEIDKGFKIVDIQSITDSSVIDKIMAAVNSQRFVRYDLLPPHAEASNFDSNKLNFSHKDNLHGLIIKLELKKPLFSNSRLNLICTRDTMGTQFSAAVTDAGKDIIYTCSDLEFIIQIYNSYSN